MNNVVSLHRSDKTGRLYSTTQLADDCGVTARTIRFYESRGLLQPQLAGATRVYTHSDRARLKIILRGKRLGFSLDEIQEYLDLYDADTQHISQVLHIRHKARERAKEMRAKLKDIEDALRELEQIEQEAVHQLKSMGVDPNAPAPPRRTPHQNKSPLEGIDP
ncbi:MAG: MerR family DNA-binding transcriptional regulator [Rhodospirillaceae bacterium]